MTEMCFIEYNKKDIIFLILIIVLSYFMGYFKGRGFRKFEM